MSRPLRTLWVALAAILLGLLPAVLRPVSASAQADSFLGLTSPTVAAPDGSRHQVHFGVMTYAGHRVLCIDAGAASPDQITAHPVTRSDQAKVAYLLQRDIGTGDRWSAAALSVYVREVLDGQQQLARTAYAALPATDRGKVAARLQQLTADADAHAGPYAAAARLVTSTGHWPTTGSVQGLAVRAASGALLPGYRYTVTLRGPARFADGSSTATGTTSVTALDLPWTATAAGSVGADVRVDGLPAGDYRVFDPGNPRIQRVIDASPTSVHATATLPATPVVGLPLHPVITTRVARQVIDAPGDFLDTYAVTGGAPGSTVTASIVVYGPFATTLVAAPAPPAGAPVAGTVRFPVTLDGSGRASGSAPAVRVRAPGRYVAVESLRAGPGWVGYTSGFGQVQESATVTQVRLRTRISDTRIAPGSVVHDAVDVSGSVDRPMRMQWQFASTPATSVSACDALRQAGWERARAAGRVRVTAGGAMDVTHDGRYDVHATAPAAPRRGVLCTSFAERLTVAGSQVAQSPLGTVGEVGSVAGVRVPPPPTSPPPSAPPTLPVVNSGSPGSPVAPGTLLAGGGCLAGAGLLAGGWTLRILGRRRAV